MTTQPTPGPWKIDEGDSSYVVNAEGVAIAEVSNPAWPRETEEANARLIAAAPKMLDVLRLVVAWGPGIEVPFVQEARALLRDLHGDPS